MVVENCHLQGRKPLPWDRSPVSFGQIGLSLAFQVKNWDKGPSSLALPRMVHHPWPAAPDMIWCNSMPLVRLGLTICVIKSLYFLVRHRVSKITLLFCLGGSRSSLKVREVKCVPGDPATMCPVLFKGSRSPLSLALRCITYRMFRPYLVRWCLVLC